MKKETVKIITIKGRVITLTIDSVTKSKYIGIDKFGKNVIISIADIQSMLPINEVKNEK